MQEHGSAVRVIRPDDRFMASSLVAVRELFRELWQFRTHIRTVFRQEFRAAYQGAGLGVVWNYLLPLLPLTVYLFLSRIRLFPQFDGVDSATYLTFGVTLWFLLAGCIQIPIQTVKARNTQAMKTSFPLSAIIASSFARLLFETGVRTLFVMVVIIATASWPAPSAFFLPLLLLPTLLLFIGIGLLLSMLNVIYQDVERVVTILLQYGIFVSGVIFPMPKEGWLGLLTLVNPFAIAIDASREIVFRGDLVAPVSFLVLSALGLGVFFLACRVFYAMEYRVRGLV